MEWQPISSAPKDGQIIDLWAKTWNPDTDTFRSERFTDCYWNIGDSMTNRKGRWKNLGQDFYPTHWILAPEPPKE